MRVHVKDGHVTLEGHVDDEGVAEQILNFTQRVPGVVSVEPRLTWPDAPAPRAVGKTLA